MKPFTCIEDNGLVCFHIFADSWEQARQGIDRMGASNHPEKVTVLTEEQAHKLYRKLRDVYEGQRLHTPVDVPEGS